MLNGDILQFTAPRKAPAASSRFGKKKKRARFGSSSFRYEQKCCLCPRPRLTNPLCPSDPAVRWVVRRRVGFEARECGGALLPLPPRADSCLEHGKLANPESKMLRPLLDRYVVLWIRSWHQHRSMQRIHRACRRDY